MIEEASQDDFDALGLNEEEREAEDTANGTMDEANFSYMEEPDPQDGVEALRAARDSTEENTNPAMIDEVLPDRVLEEDEDADPVGNGRD